MNLKKEINSLDVYEITKTVSTSWQDVVLVNILYACLIALSFFIPFLSFALAFLVMAYLEVGVYGFVLERKRGKKSDFEQIFLPTKTILKAVCVKIVVYAGIFLWGILLIVPGIIYGLNNSFAKLVYFDNRNLSTSEILAKSKELVYGKRFSIFVMAMLSLLIVACGPSIATGIILLIGLLTPVPVWASSMLIIFFTFLSVVVFAMPLFEIFLTSSYNDALERQNKPKKTEKKVKNISK